MAMAGSRLFAAAVVGAALTMLAACAPSAGTPSSSPSPGDGAEAAGVIAIGHSGLTGENADPARQGQEARDQSWATGDDAAVGSIYLRMVAQNAANEGHVANTASAGAGSDLLSAQAEEALAEVAAPALAIIQTIDNDIRCDGTDADHVVEFGENVRAAIDAVVEASPDAKILVVSQRGRPAMVAEFLPTAAENPPAGEESCEFVNGAGEYVTANADYLTAVIEAYEAEQARVCSEFAQCTDDRGANTTFADTEEDLAGGDGNHLTTAGQAKMAALQWPVVAEMFGY